MDLVGGESQKTRTNTQTHTGEEGFASEENEVCYLHMILGSAHCLAAAGELFTTSRNSVMTIVLRQTIDSQQLLVAGVYINSMSWPDYKMKLVVVV